MLATATDTWKSLYECKMKCKKLVLTLDSFMEMLTSEVYNIICNSLTLNCIRYPALPLVHNGGFHGTPPEKTTFPPEFFSYLYTICIYTSRNHNHISGKKYKIFVPFQNGGQITDFHFATFRFRPKFEKPLSQRNFSMKFGSN